MTAVYRTGARFALYGQRLTSWSLGFTIFLWAPRRSSGIQIFCGPYEFGLRIYTKRYRESLRSENAKA